MNQEDTVHTAEGVVAHGYERACLETFEDLGIVEAEENVELLLYEFVRELGTGGVAIAAVHLIDAVNPEEVHESLHELTVICESGDSLRYIVEIEDIGAHGSVGIGGYRPFRRELLLGFLQGCLTLFFILYVGGIFLFHRHNYS